MRKQIVFIGCGKKKRAYSCQAQEMYIGNFFKTCFEYANTFSPEIYILSAKYGVLPLTKVIEPYDLTLNKFTKKESAEWFKMVKQQMEELNLTDRKKIFICGKKYREGFGEVECPLQGDGMGYQVQFMIKELNKKKRRPRSLV